MRGIARSVAAGFANLVGLVTPEMPPIQRIAPAAPGTGGRSRSRTKWSGAQLRLIRAKGQARECARRRRQREARS
jgi:hypothetical protein